MGMVPKRHVWLGALIAALPFLPAFAWDPAVIDDTNPPPGVRVVYRDGTALNPAPQPARHVAAPPISYAAPLPAPAPAPAAPVASPPPAMAYVPPPAPARVMVASPAAAPTVIVAPAAPPLVVAAPSPGFGHDEMSLGIEGFYDRYQEPIADLDSRTGYGALTGDFTRYYDDGWFDGVDGRASYGREHYKSAPSGTADGINDWELEARATGGYSFVMGAGRLEPYIGFGTRYYYDNLKGVITSKNKAGYDRRILQFYMPIGTSYHFVADGWSFRPNLEYDPLLLGKVQSRFAGTGLGLFNVTDTQEPLSGYGIRGEFMMGPAAVEPGSFLWEVGPFFRYWNFRQSNDSTDKLGNTWFEPHNTRLQLGAEARLDF